MGFELSADNAVDYLVSRGVISAEAGRTATAEFLGGGVSNVVIRVNPSEPNTDALVLKQSLPKLRVEDDWFADQARIHRERAGIDYVGALAGVGPAGSAWAVPAVVDEDPENFVYVMTATPPDAVNWKDALLAGRVDVEVASKVGAMLGTIHRASLVNPGEPPPQLRGFADLDCFVQLRIDPYHRATAAVHADLSPVIEAEAQRMLPSESERRTLVHGDFSPKNIMVAGESVHTRVFLLDFEVAHLGNPVFDLAFMLNHFTLKAIHRSQLATLYNDAAAAFWAAYLGALGAPAIDGPAVDAALLERDTIRQLGALLLARIDGKSPAEYITEQSQKEKARYLARNILTGRIATLPQLHGHLTGKAIL